MPSWTSRGRAEAAVESLARNGYLLVIGIAVVLVLGLSATLQELLSRDPGPDWLGPPPSFRDWIPLCSGLIGGAAALAAAWPGTPPRRLSLLGPAAPVAVLAASLVLWPAEHGMYGYTMSILEVFAMFLAANLVAWHAPRRAVAVMAAATTLAILSQGLRSEGWGLDSVGWMLLLATMTFLPGLVLRWRERERGWRVEEARREERLSLARDLHDVVAHQVSGIVVQVQALRHVADRDPAVVAAALPQIEDAGTAALAAMRRMVGALREEGDAPLEPHDLAVALRAMEEPGDIGRPRVEVAVDGDTGALPEETASAVLRMAQEAVTNARRHARDASLVRVELEAGTAGARLRVADDGRGGGSVHAAGGGYGLIGMAERAKLLGGSFTAGPADDAPGWRVEAELPAGTAVDGGTR
ncbi:histidine kinase [Nocardiopsis sp. RSe5-2]|uniref:histidine kinase n=1 Tax=Nocardiopsis endophytica TaxID=3018445 RepID=A0ABT4U101_9ACTN|nr:histidine kinase [Nocardiopsis endophytica]MDA2810629.1 histidine kinase [Nocardiopsis endophytica]